MKTLEKLAKADKLNQVTKKDGSLTKHAIAAIKDYRNNNGKFYTHYYSGSGRFASTLSNERVETICKLLGYKFEKGNDAPRGGAAGNYIKVSPKAYRNILHLTL